MGSCPRDSCAIVFRAERLPTNSNFRRVSSYLWEHSLNKMTDSINQKYIGAENSLANLKSRVEQYAVATAVKELFPRYVNAITSPRRSNSIIITMIMERRQSPREMFRLKTGLNRRSRSGRGWICRKRISMSKNIDDLMPRTLEIWGLPDTYDYSRLSTLTKRAWGFPGDS